MIRRIKLDGDKTEPIAAASSMYEEVLQDIIDNCYHQGTKKCKHCFTDIPYPLFNRLCEVRVRKAINRLLDYQRNEIKKQFYRSAFGVDDGPP